MALSANIVSFSANTDLASAATEAINGFGFQPEVIMLLHNASEFTTDSQGGGDYGIGFGAAISATTRAAGVTRTRHNNADPISSYRMNRSIGMAISVNPANAILEGSLDFDSFTADGYIQAYDDQFVLASNINVLGLGGDVTNSDIVTFLEPGSTGTTAVTGNLGANTPDLVLLFGAPHTGQGAIAAGKFMLGAYDGTTQWVTAVGATQSTPGTAVRTSYGRSGEALANISNNALTVESRATIQSLIANGFILDWSAVNTANNRYYALMLVGGNYSVGTFNTSTSAGNLPAESGFGYKPSALLWSSCNTGECASGVTSPDAAISIGMATSTTSRVVSAFRDTNGVSTTDVNAGNQFDEVYLSLDSTPAVTALADVASFDAGGFTPTMDDAEDTAASWVGYIAFGPAAAAGGGGSSSPFYYLRRRYG